VDDLGGGVGVEAMTGGVLVRLLGAGEAGALKASTSNASPSGRLITMAALLRAGLEKELLGVALAFCCG
jgi:hypothetical protein